MSHLAPFLAIALIVLLVTDRGNAAVALAARAALATVRGVVDYLRALGRWYVRVAFGP